MLELVQYLFLFSIIGVISFKIYALNLPKEKRYTTKSTIMVIIFILSLLSLIVAIILSLILKLNQEWSF